MLAHVGSGGLHQVLADMQLAGEAGAQRVAQLIQPFGRAEGCGPALVGCGVRLGQQLGHRDGIGLALPDARSARHGIMQPVPERGTGQIDQLDGAEHGRIDRRLLGGHPALDLGAEQRRGRARTPV